LYAVHEYVLTAAAAQHSTEVYNSTARTVAASLSLSVSFICAHGEVFAFEIIINVSDLSP
jgi:hypothetical protein